jgi:hypothetical protein
MAFSILRYGLLAGAGLVAAISCGSDDRAKAAAGEAGAGGEASSSGGEASSVGGSQSGGGATTPSEGGRGTQASAGASVGGASQQAAAGGASLGGAAGTALTDAGGGAAGAPDSAPVVCSDYAPGPPPTKPATVRLVNGTTHNIYLGSPAQACEYHFDFQLFDGQSELQPSRDACAHTCEEIQQSGCDCSIPCVSIVTLVSPGKHFDVGWPGTVFSTAEMPAQCAPDASCNGRAQTCLIEEAAPAVALTIRATAYTDKECDAGQCFDCTTGVSGSCIVTGAVRTKGTALLATGEWNGESVLQLSFVDPT